MIDYDVGDMIVCIDGSFKNSYHVNHAKKPIEGSIYICRGFMPDDIGGVDDLAIWLVEIVNPVITVWDHFNGREVKLEPGFFARRFRKVKETKIDEFQKILKETPIDAKPDDEGLPSVRELENAQ